MLKSAVSLLLIVLLTLPFSSIGKEKKEKVKKLSKKEMTAAMSGLNSSVEDLKKKVEQLEADKAALEAKVTELNTQNDAAKQEAAAAKTQIETAKQEVAKAVASSGGTAPTGLSFKVQVGAYQNFRIGGDFDKSKAMTTEDVDGFKKYIIGYFGGLDQAQAFTKDVKKMGIQDAWIVPYNNGQRISDEEAEQLLGKPFRDKNAKSRTTKKVKVTKTTTTTSTGE